MSIMSMTGFGRGEAKNDGMKASVEIKTVNHRYCDIYVKMPRIISFLEEKIRRHVGSELNRGKIEVYITFDDTGENCNSISIDEGLASNYIKALESLKGRFSLRDEISLSMVSRFPDIIKLEKLESDEETVWNLVKEALGHAIASVSAMREKEGGRLKADMLEKAALIEESLALIKKRAPEVPREYRQRLETRLKEMIDQQVVDQNRLAAEVAIFADRCSIDEEIVRLGSHINQFRSMLDSGRQAGRKLDFIIQEMNREINTIGSKANDLEITRCVVDLKSELEKIREQAQNIE